MAEKYVWGKRGNTFKLNDNVNNFSNSNIDVNESKRKKSKDSKKVKCDTINYIPMELTTGNKLRKIEYN